MIGNSEIHVASSARRLGHGAQRIDAIGQVCMGVQDAADILLANQFPQFALQRPFDFALAFAQLGRNERQPERCIDVLLFNSNDLASPPQSLPECRGEHGNAPRAGAPDLEGARPGAAPGG